MMHPNWKLIGESTVHVSCSHEISQGIEYNVFTYDSVFVLCCVAFLVCLHGNPKIFTGPIWPPHKIFSAGATARWSCRLQRRTMYEKSHTLLPWTRQRATWKHQRVQWHLLDAAGTIWACCPSHKHWRSWGSNHKWTTHSTSWAYERQQISWDQIKERNFKPRFTGRKRETWKYLLTSGSHCTVRLGHSSACVITRS